jgi:hypothetical protein
VAGLGALALVLDTALHRFLVKAQALENMGSELKAALDGFGYDIADAKAA